MLQYMFIDTPKHPQEQNEWEIQMEAGGGPACINQLRSQAYFLMNFNGVHFFFSLQ